MVEVRVTKRLQEEINKKFKGEAVKIFELIYSLEESPTKGKVITQVGGILIKELKYGSFRFYFITDGYKIKLLEQGEISDILIKFVRMSDKNNQQKVIDEIKKILRTFGGEGFG